MTSPTTNAATSPATSPTTSMEELDMTTTKIAQPIAKRVRASLLRDQQVLAALLLFSALTGWSRGKHLQEQQEDREAGVTTLEIAVIALGLFLLAGVVVAAITAAVNNNLGQIG
ncbi:hypothetical protein GCM10027586_01990 [Kineococcus gypseus]|uniref:hypothetical protein n=1 Tax=Kineococcus gypseus TaxID=1637102 RepID=UPI003D7F03E1